MKIMPIVWGGCLIVFKMGFANQYPCWTNTVNINDLGCVLGSKPVNYVSFLSGQNYVSDTDPNKIFFQTGLYPGGTSTIPSGHLAKGLTIASTIKPLGINGQVDGTNGLIKAYGEGMSNTKAIFDELQSDFFTNNSDLNTRFVFDNQAQGGCDLVCWLGKGVGTVQNDVQIALIYHSNNRPQTANGTPTITNNYFKTAQDKQFPGHAQVTKDLLKQRILQLKQQFPNLKIVYLSSREFGGWSCPPAFTGSAAGYREPVAYEEAFPMKWLIEDQINGDPSLSFEGAGAPAPWLCWGPYVWDPAKAYPQAWWSAVDGVHPCENSADALAAQWYNFLMADPTSMPWLAKTPGTIKNVPPLVTASANPSSGDAPLTVVLTGTASDNDGVITAYGWIFGDGGTMNNIYSVQHIYQTAGTYKAIFWSTDDSNATRNDTVSISVSNPGQTNQPPVVSITADPTTGDAPLTVQFNAVAQDADGTVDFVYWDFGDQTQDGGALNPSHTYQDSGNYLVIFTATDNLGAKSSDSLWINVGANPVGLKANPIVSAIGHLNIYPNPVQSATTISYQLKAENSQNVFLGIYDLNGMLIKGLLNQQQGGGLYSILWDGKNWGNQSIPGGIYLVRLKTLNWIETKKVVLLK